MRRIKRISAWILTLAILLTLTVPALAASGVQNEVQGSAAYMVSAVKSPEVGSIGGEWAIIHRCKRCGKLNSNRLAADDNPMKLMSIAMKPLCEPPFPLERIEEMTALMAGDGRME